MGKKYKKAVADVILAGDDPTQSDELPGDDDFAIDDELLVVWNPKD